MSGQSTQGPVPKFASFRPRIAAEDPGSEVKSAKSSGTASRSTKERKHRHHHRRRSRSRESISPKEQKPPTTAIPVPDETASLYIVDRKGDAKNLVYGSLHRYSVPTFHRVGAGSVLGTKKWVKIDRDVSDDKGIVLSVRTANFGSRREKYVFARNEKKASRLLRIRPGAIVDAPALGDVDFIPLQEGSRKRKRLDGSSDEGSEDGREHYRSIEGKAKAITKPADDALEYFTESDDSGRESGRNIRVDDVTRQKMIVLSRAVDEDPQNIEAWIALINHQDALLGIAEVDARRNITSAERRSTADIKVHLYEKALAKAGSTLAAKERLLLGLMAEGAKIWDFKTQSEKWEEISQNNIDSICLWKQYLDFRQTAFAPFRYEEVKEIFLKRIKLLKKAIESQKKSDSAVQVLFEALIYTTLRLTLFMQEAGYSEISVALWQALLEFNLLGPGLSSSTRLEIFKEFWENEVPRIGEDGATGWKNFDTSADAPNGKSDNETPSEYLESNDIFEGWVSGENFREYFSREPARTLDDVTEDDPYRVILWSDIEDLIFDLSTASDSVHLKTLLVDAYLIFCRLPPCSITEQSRIWWKDSFVRGELLQWSTATLKGKINMTTVPKGSTNLLTGSDISCGEHSNPDSVSTLFQQHSSQSFVIGMDSLFGSATWIQAMKPWKNLYAGDDGPVSYKWVRNTLHSLAQVVPGDTMALFYLAFEWINDPDPIKKVARALLKKRPQSVRLYNAYALIEWLKGDKDASSNVIVAALGMSASLPESEQQDCILLWMTWSWLLLEAGDNEGSLKCLYSIADGIPDISRTETSSPALFLKTRQYLASMRDHHITHSPARANIYAECLALTLYLSSKSSTETTSQKQGDLESALKVFDDYSEALNARGFKYSTEHEASRQSAVRLLHHHVQIGPFRPALIREHTSKSLALFPQNTIFLTLYTWNESRLRIDDRVRTMLRSVILTPNSDTITSRIFAIQYELQSGNVYSTGAAFENAVASPNCKSNPGLWRLYIMFCAQTKQFRNQATEVFYRGLRACPWAKKVYLMAFAELKGILGFEELRVVYKILSEKELRVHIDLEDRLEEWDERGGGKVLYMT